MKQVAANASDARGIRGAEAPIVVSSGDNGDAMAVAPQGNGRSPSIATDSHAQDHPSHSLSALRGNDGASSIAAQGDGGIAPLSAEDAVRGSDLSGFGAPVIRTVTPNLTLPNNALYQIVTSPGSPYVVQTDPRFANDATWRSASDMLAQLDVDAQS
ncbi:hypothetical protein, partial [Pararobbsia silviterrae]|uniref:hypothetical protein n=1 Tax=Pararobbsia silviterrae TaxID=1792498 RepID=UPI0011C39B5D